MGVTIDLKRFTNDLSSLNMVIIDSNILIYHLEDIEPYGNLTQAFITLLGNRKIKSIIATVSITELMTKPFSEGNVKKINTFKNFIQSVPNSDLISLNYEIAIKAASIKCQFGLRTPDAIIIATGIVCQANGLLTNDLKLKKCKEKNFKIIVFDEYLVE